MAGGTSEGHVSLREDKAAGTAVRDLAASGALDQCSSLDLEYGVGVGDETLALVGAHGRNLRSLNLNACQEYTDEGLLSIAKGCTSLTSLSLYWNVKITDESVSQVCAANTSLTTLRLSGCKHVGDQTGVMIATKCRNLTSLDLTRCPDLTCETLEALAAHNGKLTSFLIYASAFAKDVGVAAMCRSLHNLTVLDLCGSKDLTDEGLAPLAAGTLPALQRFNLGWCGRLGDPAVKSIAAGCHEIRYLYLLGNKEITLDGLQHLSKGCTKLCGLDIAGLCKVEDRSLDAMSALFPNLTLLAKLGSAPNYDDGSAEA
ncbi:hypothetical protein T484DRAFT_1946153 [Baffinella frigidus]|nr:hypothetical protein T484DRAFT_1946153 [Cryptophyta sp. CCMP2293]